MTSRPFIFHTDRGLSSFVVEWQISLGSAYSLPVPVIYPGASVKMLAGVTKKR
jgi:hypothetical protein